MKFEKKITLKDLASFLGREYFGPDDHIISGINEIHKVENGDIVFVDHPKYFKKAIKSAATTILITEKVDFPEGKGLIVSENPFDDFNKIIEHNRKRNPWSEKFENAEIHSTAMIFPNVSIGNNVKIGAHSKIGAGVVLCDHTIIGENVVIGPNSVIGHDAFYYKKKSDGYTRLESCGRAIIENKVEIGALTTIDCGVSGDTIIGEGTKIDNQVHIGHDSVIGKHCLLAANVGVAGCVTTGDYVTIWGQAGVAADVYIADNVTLLAQSGTNKDLEKGKTYFGSPCGEVRVKFKEMAAIRKLPTLIENL